MSRNNRLTKVRNFQCSYLSLMKDDKVFTKFTFSNFPYCSPGKALALNSLEWVGIKL